MLGGIVSCRHWWTVCSLLAQLMTLAFLVKSLFNITCSEAFIKNTFYCFQIVTYFVNIGWNEMKWIKFCFQLLLFQNKSWTSLWVLERKPERPNFRNSLWWMFFSLILFLGFPYEFQGWWHTCELILLATTDMNLVFSKTFVVTGGQAVCWIKIFQRLLFFVTRTVLIGSW